MAVKKRRRWTLLILGLLVLAALAPFVWVLGAKLLNMKAEYVTAGVISDTRAFAERTEGKWPRTWQDLGDWDFTIYTQMNFDLDPATATQEEVLQSIQPRSGKYYTYPHAKEQLESLYADLCKYRKKPGPAADSGLPAQ